MRDSPYRNEHRSRFANASRSDTLSCYNLGDLRLNVFMAYRRRHYSGYDTNWVEYHERQRARISSKYGGIDKDVRAAFFSLAPSTLSEFFQSYKSKYGASAASYARKTYLTWKSGEIEPSGQTSERLLEILPSFLTVPAKCELLQKLREHYRNPESYELTLSIYNWRGVIGPIVQRLIHKSYTAELPENVQSRLNWLSSGSMQAAKMLLAEAEVQAARNSVALLHAEFQNIDRLLVSLPARKLIQHSICLPYGIIKITFNRSMKMENEDQSHSLVPQDQNTSLEKQTPGSLLDNALSHLDQEQVKKLSATAAEKALNIKEEKIRADHRFVNASRDMNEFIENASRLDRSQASDYKMQAEFESASGKTHVQVAKQGSKITLVIAIVIGIVLLLLFLSRH